EKLLKKGLTEVPDSVNLKEALADFYLDQRNFTAAEPLLAELEERISEKPFWQLLKGKEALLKGRARQAIKYLTKAHQSRDDTQTTFLLAQACRQVGELGLAKGYLQTVVSRTRASDVRAILISVLLDLRDYAEAARHAKVLVQANEKDSRAWLLLARAQIGAGNQKDVFHSLRQAIKYDPDNPQPHLMMAVLEEKRENLAKAEEIFKKALATGKNKQICYLQLLYFYQRHKKGQPEAFDKKIQTVVKEAKEEFPDVYWDIFLLPADPDARMKVLEERLKKDQDDINSLRALASFFRFF
ncbi:unnamed protein product, partial [marine sediment metagenome]